MLVGRKQSERAVDGGSTNNLNKRQLKQVEKSASKPQVISTNTSADPSPVKQTQNVVNKSNVELKRRGRKRERDDIYFVKAINKIKEIREQLKTAKADGISVKERQKLRNQISAQQSRIKKKEEVMFLHRAVKDKDDKMKALIKCLTLILQPDDLIKIHSMMQKPWGLEDATIIPECTQIDQNTVRLTKKQTQRVLKKQPVLQKVNSNQILFDEQDTVSECSQQSVV